MIRSGLTLDVRYRLDERIAAGGVGQVWHGTDLLLERPVAVKLLRPEFTSHPETLERFRAEARHAGALTHPCIAQVYDYCDGGPEDSPYLVMELVDGQSLADILAAGTIDAARTMDIAAQVAAGLAAAHRTGLVHRDIKPGNILVSSDGLVKITDFGIAHAAGAAPLTAPEMVMGTAQYLAPERITGADDGPAGDLYSLGIVLHECLSGLPPFAGTTAEVMSAHLYVPLPPLPSDVPPAVSDLVARLTAKDPAERLSDAAELAAAARRLSAAVVPSQPMPAVEPAQMAQPARSSDPLRTLKPAGPTGKDSRPPGNSRRRVLAVGSATAALALVIVALASGALRDTGMHGQAASGHGIQRNVSPSISPAAGVGQANASPGPSAASNVNAGSTGNRSTRKTVSKRSTSHSSGGSSGTGGTTAGSGSQTGTTSSGSGSGSSGSGGGIKIQLPLPVPSVGVSLGL